MKVHRSSEELNTEIKNLRERVEGLVSLIELYKKQLWELRQASSELEKTKNLLQGYQKVIQDLSAKLSQKDS
tara:strand:+ start:299 stop:514 length:216 start_codon:yes stop_codon:yes gene_type:complete